MAWVQITQATSKSQVGNTEELLSEPLLSGAPARAKGQKTPTDVTITVVNNTADAGQAALKAAGLTSGSYAFKFEKTDSTDPGTNTNTIFYNRGLVAELMDSEGGPSTMDMKETTVGMQQFWIEVAPEAIA